MEKKKSKEEISMDIPVKGSLGLLAYGAKGIIAWREVRIKNFEKNLANKNSNPLEK